MSNFYRSGAELTSEINLDMTELSSESTTKPQKGGFIGGLLEIFLRATNMILNC